MAQNPKNATAAERDNPDRCGIIMPIAAMPGYEADHWAEVLSLISRAISNSGRTPEPVWAGGAADIIQERIVRNLFDLPMAVCDVSGLNSNVMLELGMRLAFGKPTIIITDELMKPPFDINAIEYIPYPRDLHILRAEAFIERLAERIEQLSELAKSSEYRPFIKTFGPIEPGTPGTEGIPIGNAVLSQLEQMGSAIRRLERSQTGGSIAANAIYTSANPQDTWASPENLNRLTHVVTLSGNDHKAVVRRLRGLRGVFAVFSLPENLAGPNKLGVIIDNMSPLKTEVTLASIQEVIGADSFISPIAKSKFF